MNELTKKLETRTPLWRKNAPFMLTFHSLMAAMAGALLAIVITDNKLDYWFFPVAFLAFSLICFTLGIEKFGDILDEGDIDKYLAWLLAYNSGVISMFFGIAFFITRHYHLYFLPFHLRNIWYIMPYMIAFIASMKWIGDIKYLLFENNKDYDEYRSALLREEPMNDPGEPDFLTRAHQYIRELTHGKDKK